ncbi:MAG: PRC-barrel domain-containing protein [Planctomycetaceae bacterium]
MFSRIALSLALVLGLSFAFSIDSQAKDNKQNDDATITVTANKISSQNNPATIRASKLIGMDIVNSNDESIGEIHDIVLDTNTGMVRYAAITYGGFLGVGDKLFAVPFRAFEIRREEGDADDLFLVLNVTQEQLEGAEGFDEDHWPSFTDEQFTRELDKRYGVDVQIGNGAVNVDVNSDGK